jgi:hypothetical protein
MGSASRAHPEASMGSAGRRRAGAATFGPYGYLNLGVPTAVLALAFWGLHLRLPDPLGLHWAWFGLAVVVAFAALGKLIGGRGAETDLRYRNGPRNLAYWTQYAAPWVMLALFLVAFIGYLTDQTALLTWMLGVACGVTAGLAPTFFREPPT